MEQRWRNIICEITRATQQHGLLCSLRNRSDQSGWSIKNPQHASGKRYGAHISQCRLTATYNLITNCSGMINETTLLLLFALSPLAAAENIYAPGQAALKFNQWYIAQLDQNKPPVLNPDIMNEYVASGTIAAIKEMYSGDSNDKDMPDADMFIKAQDWDDDWNQITVLHSDFDAVCTNVYVAFGKKQDHVIADCLVEEQGKWKVRSATLIK
ncbi:DUF3828 domain-containing protein [Enterobacter cloacae complex sp. 2024EL-00243]